MFTKLNMHRLAGRNMDCGRMPPLLTCFAMLAALLINVALAQGQSESGAINLRIPGAAQSTPRADGNPQPSPRNTEKSLPPASPIQKLLPPRSEDAAAISIDATQPSNPFWTKHAYFVPSRFSELPGWDNDKLGEAWSAFRQSCTVLASRRAWAGPCQRAGMVSANDDGELRRFLEREFTLYQIRN